jgi:hypothetical protein
MNNGKDKSLESWIWDAACSIRGAKDAPKFKDYILYYAQEIARTYLPRAEAEARWGFDQAGALSEKWARKPSLFFGGPDRQRITAQLPVHALDLPEPTSFTAKHAR